MARPVVLVALVFAAVGVALAAHSTALANAVYPSGATGYDVSQYECGQTPPGSFGVVAVTGGRAFYHNSCLAQQFRQAAGRAYAPSLYMNLNTAVGTTASKGNTGPAGTCKKKDKACIAYNYGYNAAGDARAYATSQGATADTWWLDIETANSWSKDETLNRLTIQGAFDYLQQHAASIGVYSTSYQWGVITGGMQIAAPNWVAGASSLEAAPSYCGSPFTGPGASVWLVQYPNGSFDGNYAC